MWTLNSRLESVISVGKCNANKETQLSLDGMLQAQKKALEYVACICILGCIDIF